MELKSNKIRAWILIFIFLIPVITSMMNEFPSNIFTSDVYGKNSGKNTPNLSQGGGNETIILQYSLDLSLKSESINSNEKLKFQLKIEGEEGIYGNGTINYSLLEGNLQDPDIIDMLSLFFSEEQVAFFSNESSDNTLNTFFSYRREALNVSETDDFNANASYTPFWLNTSGHYSGYLSAHRVIRFYDVQDYFTVAILDNYPSLSQYNWSPNLTDLRKNLPIISSFQISTFISDYLSIKMYYDMIHSVLLRSEIFYSGYVQGEEAIVEGVIFLSDTSLNFEFSPNNPYYKLWITELILWIGGVVVVSSGILVIYMKKTKKGPFSSKTDQNGGKDVLDLI